MAVSQRRCGAPDQIRSDLVIEVFCPPFWHQVLFELPAILSIQLETEEDCRRVKLTLQISLLEEGRG